ncbi:MAG: zinc ribbon domain-containing protein [Kiloniellaceae bacterium]
MKCPDCGAANPAKAQFCGGCGKKFEAASGGASTWESVFKWIGIAVVGLFVLGIVSGF